MIIADKRKSLIYFTCNFLKLIIDLEDELYSKQLFV